MNEKVYCCRRFLIINLLTQYIIIYIGWLESDTVVNVWNICKYDFLTKTIWTGCFFRRGIFLKFEAIVVWCWGIHKYHGNDKREDVGQGLMHAGGYTMTKFVVLTKVVLIKILPKLLLWLLLVFFWNGDDAGVIYKYHGNEDRKEWQGGR